MEGGGDLYPLATLRWTQGNNNWLAYAMGGVPVGAYQVGRLANIGLNHWSLDAGGGYTYLDAKSGREFSAVAGLTYNFENEDTNYQNGVDSHIDLAASQFLNEQLHIGLVGYIYYQLSGDSGSGAATGRLQVHRLLSGTAGRVLFPGRPSTRLRQSSRLLRVRRRQSCRRLECVADAVVSIRLAK